MDTITLENDIKVFCMQAKNFPEGIMDAFNALKALSPATETRTYYGISRPEKGIIMYKAAVEEFHDGEAEKLGLERFIIRKGRYISSTIQDYMKNTGDIGKTFQSILSRQDLDPDGYCVEWYFNNKDVRCMVRLNE